MKQVLHIFRKDARHLRWEIALLLVTIFLFAWSEMRSPFGAWPFGAWGYAAATYVGIDGYVFRALPWVNPFAQILVVVIAIVLVGRVAHAEALPGDRQFWLTRPYSWKSLLGAKCLFLLAFVIVPMTLSDVALLAAAKFHPSQYLSGLLWEQLLRVAVVVAPALALAAITRNAVSQIFTLLGLMVVTVFSFGILFGREEVDPSHHWAALGWFYMSITVGLMLVCSTSVVVWQYARRKTFAARIAFGCAVALAALVPWIPESVAMGIERYGSKNTVDPAAIHVALDPPTQGESRVENRAPVLVQLPLRISGIPEGVRMWADQVRVNFAQPYERAQWLALDNSHVLMIATMYPGEFSTRGPIQVRASLLVTLGGNPRTVAQCPCKLPYRDARSIAVRGREFLLPSYSPFPAELTLDPVQTLGFRGDGALTLEDPVQHFFYDFELDHVRIADYIITEPQNGRP